MFLIKPGDKTNSSSFTILSLKLVPLSITLLTPHPPPSLSLLAPLPFGSPSLQVAKYLYQNCNINLTTFWLLTSWCSKYSDEICVDIVDTIGLIVHWSLNIIKRCFFPCHNKMPYTKLVNHFINTKIISAFDAEDFIWSSKPDWRKIRKFLSVVNSTVVNLPSYWEAPQCLVTKFTIIIH